MARIFLQNMTATEQARFQEVYTRHLRALKLQGKRDKTIDSYARAVRRVSNHFFVALIN